MAKKPLKSAADFVWSSLKIPLSDPAPLQQISELLCENGYEALHDIIMAYLVIFDRTNGGMITFKDFQTISSPDFDPFANEETISALFSTFDKQDNGAISPEDILAIAKEVSEPITPEEAQEMIKAFDSDKDGLVNLREFKTIVKTKR